ncbi:hypothetical protein [Gallibacterium sp. ZY190522]
MDWQYVVNAIPKFIDATLLTLYLAGAGIIFSLIIGIICAVLLVYPVRVLSRITKAYIEISCKIVYHEMTFARQVSDHIIFMDQSNIIE